MSDNTMRRDIDLLDLQILRVINDTPMWKKKVHDHVADQCSLQTVGRRIDQLHNDGLLDSRVLEPAELNRELILGFETTSQGQEAIAEARRHVLLETASREAFADDRWERVDDELLVDLIGSEFDLTDEERAVLRHCDRQELAAIVAYYFSRTEVSELAEQNTDLADILATQPIS